MNRWRAGGTARIGIVAMLAALTGLVWAGNALAQAEVTADESEVRAAVAAMADWYRPIDAVRWLRDHLQSFGKDLALGQLLSLGNLGINRPLHYGAEGGDVYTADRYHVEYYGLTDDGEPATVTINVNRGGD